MAAYAAALIGSGTSKSGWPMLRLTGSLIDRASSKTLRMPDDSMLPMRSAIQRSAGEESAIVHISAKRRASRYGPADLADSIASAPGWTPTRGLCVFDTPDGLP